MEYQHKLVQAIAEFWESWQPKMEESIESMPAIERLFFRQLVGFLNISIILEKLDSSPETVELIREKLLKVVSEEAPQDKPPPSVEPKKLPHVPSLPTKASARRPKVEVTNTLVDPAPETSKSTIALEEKDARD